MYIKLLVGIAVVLVVGVGGWWSFGKHAAEAPSELMQSQKDGVSVDQMNGVDMAESTGLSGSGTLKSLMSMGKNITCDLTFADPAANGGTVGGTIKIAGERMRGDFEVQQTGMAYASYIIHDGEYIYTWSDSEVGSFALKLPAEDGQNNDDTNQVAQPMDLGNEINYECRPWSVDATVFVPPSEINFMSIEEMFQSFGASVDMSNFQQ